MTSRFDVTLEELERTVRVAGAAQVEVQGEPRVLYDGGGGCAPAGGGPADGDGE